MSSSNKASNHVSTQASTPTTASADAMSDPKERLSAIPWCRALLQSSEWAPANNPNRVPKPSTEDSFFAETLSTPRTIRACVTLRNAQESQRGIEGVFYDEIRELFELGDGLNGHPRIAHGGFVTTMIDEVMGILITVNIQARIDKGIKPHEGNNCFTACTSLVLLCSATR